MHILTHRGLEPSNPSFYSESTREAFESHLSRGFGLEVDVNFTKDGIILFHDATLKRLTGTDERFLKDLTNEEALSIRLPKGHLTTLVDLLDLAQSYPSQLLALHFKGAYQQHVERLIHFLSFYKKQFPQLLVIDLLPDTAKRLRTVYPTLSLAASVVHPLDQKRYQKDVQGTLLTLEEFFSYGDLYDTAWLDEWQERLYTQETFASLRSEEKKIFLVTPELHATSPGLLGGEAHPDAVSKERLFKRIEEIIALCPDGVCTDYPEEVRHQQLAR